MKQKLLKAGSSLLFITLLFSCNTPNQPRFLMETKYGWWNMAWCCDKTGDDCYNAGHGWDTYKINILQPYVQNDSINKFFERSDWQRVLPELSDKPELVSSIKNNNLRGVIIDSFAVVFLKDRLQPMTTSNVYVAFKYGEKSCDKWLEEAGVQ